VSEVLQARVEESGGTFLEINRLESLRDLFGDPCPNRRKNLVINYEIHGSSGSFVAEEVEGHLKKVREGKNEGRLEWKTVGAMRQQKYYAAFLQPPT